MALSDPMREDSTNQFKKEMEKESEKCKRKAGEVKLR